MCVGGGGGGIGYDSVASFYWSAGFYSLYCECACMWVCVTVGKCGFALRCLQAVSETALYWQPKQAEGGPVECHIDAHTQHTQAHTHGTHNAHTTHTTQTHL